MAWFLCWQTKNPWCPPPPGGSHPRESSPARGAGVIRAAPQRTPHTRAGPPRGIRHSSPSLRRVQRVVCAGDAVPQAVITGIAPGSVLGGHRGRPAAGPRRPVGGPDASCCRRRNRWLPRSASSGRARRCCDSAPCQLPLVAEPWGWFGPSGTAGRSVMVRTTPTPGQDPDRSLPDRLAANWWSSGFRHALPGGVPVRRWTGAHDEHPRPQINLVERRHCRFLFDSKWFHSTLSPAASRIHLTERQDILAEIAGMIGGTWRSIGVPWHENPFPGRQRKDERRLGPIDVSPVDQPVNQSGCAIGDALSAARPRGSPPTWVRRGHLLRDPIVGDDADEETGCRHGADGGRRSRRKPDDPVPIR